MRTYLLLIGFLAVTAYSCNQQKNINQMSEMTILDSPHSVDSTLKKLEAIINEKGLKVFGVINHEEGARKVDMELRPTSVVIFGNPAIGTKLMLADQKFGIDLPMKFLVWEDEDKNTKLGYYPIHDIASKYEIADDHEVLDKIKNAMKGIADKAVSE